MKKRLLNALLILLPVCLSAQNSAFEINEKLTRGINLGNCLEAPRNQSWGNEIREEYPQLIAEFGFDAVRIPVRWSDWANESVPYTIEQHFVDSVKRVVDWCMENELMVVLNIHHFEEIFDDPNGYEEMLIYLWGQISEVFIGYSDSLLFELLNEPHGSLDADTWNQMFPRVIDTIRHSNPTRKLVIGPPDYNSAGSVDKLIWPENDTNLILTVHYYNPFQFTHQGASWVDGSEAWIGNTWDSTLSQRNAIANDFNKVTTFAETHNVPVYVGEFGAYSAADMVSRRKWTATCARTFESKGFSWAYWEFLSGFGVYDPGDQIWRNDLLNALTEQIDPASIPPEPWEASNADFSNGLAGWSFQTLGEEVVAEANADTGVAEFHISQTDDTFWHIQFIQGGLEFIQGAEYRYSFDAWSAEDGAKLSTSIGRNSDPYDSYWGGATETLSMEKKNFSFDFTMEKPTDANSRVVFNLGFTPGVIFIDNVNIEKLADPVWVTGIVVSAGSAVIDTYQGSLLCSVDVAPGDAYNDSVSWSLTSGSSLATLDEFGLLTATGDDDGTVTVRATATDGSGVYGEVTVTLVNQNVGRPEQLHGRLNAWFNQHQLICELPRESGFRRISLIGLTGSRLKTVFPETGRTREVIDLEDISPGIYFLEYFDGKQSEIIKLVFSDR